ncbi:hypothetical protein vseg_006135 [Gypsophila vaccaria]
MEIDPFEVEALRKKSESLKTLSMGPISSSISKLSGSSRVLPSEKDFHFYYNFDEFRAPIDEIGVKSQSMLRQIGSAKRLWGGKELVFPEDVEDDSCDWLVNVNDEVMERFDVSVDEFSRLRKEEEEAARTRPLVDENGFQLVCGKKKKAALAAVNAKEENLAAASPSIRVAERDKKTVGPKPKVPFHIPTIRRPQEEYNILVNNSNQPYQHVWLERSEDGARFIHPLEKLSVSDFVDTNVDSLKPVEPPPYESTPFKMVEDVKDLKEMAAKLRSVNELAVDLEHNQYRSFQGLTCLMQISTRTEDFVVDTLKLRIHIGPYLREIFKDPSKKKIMHGADRDIAWLQRDFGIYVCNLFDTGQASRVLQLERNSLEYLLQHFCGVAANKEYQNADWRLRPIPKEMLRYAREDTHYLLYIYDLMRIRLVLECADPENSNALLLEVYQRSYDLCMQLYEKELLTDTSYLYIYGVQGANLNAKQLSVVAGLYAWRDAVAREEDESTGYILPNKLLLEIAKQMPLTTSNLKRLLKSKHPYVERSLSSVINIIRHSVQNASCFEAVAEQLKEGRIQVPQLIAAEDDFPELQTAGDISEGNNDSPREQVISPLHPEGSYKFTGVDNKFSKDRRGGSFEVNGQNGNIGNNGTEKIIPLSLRDQLGFPMQNRELTTSTIQPDKVSEATIQVLKKPGGAFGALLGSSTSKKKTNINKGEFLMEQMKSSVNLPFYSFSQTDQEPKQAPKQAFQDRKRTSPDAVLNGERPFESASSSKSEGIILLDADQHSEHDSEELNTASEAQPVSTSMLADVINLDSDDDEELAEKQSAEEENNQSRTSDQAASEPELVVLDDDEDDDEPMSLSDLSSSFQKCLQDVSQEQINNQDDKPEDSDVLHFKPFDYEAARKQIQFGETTMKRTGSRDGDDNLGKKKSSVSSRSKQDELLPQGRRRQAFPASGNRSSTFR